MWAKAGSQNLIQAVIRFIAAGPDVTAALGIEVEGASMFFRCGVETRSVQGRYGIDAAKKQEEAVGSLGWVTITAVW
jgi:hypothetical protein